MDKHTVIYELTMTFVEFGMEEELAYELAVKSEELIEQGILEIEEKICKLLVNRGVQQVKEGEQNGGIKKI